MPSTHLILREQGVRELFQEHPVSPGEQRAHSLHVRHPRPVRRVQDQVRHLPPRELSRAGQLYQLAAVVQVFLKQGRMAGPGGGVEAYSISACTQGKHNAATLGFTGREEQTEAGVGIAAKMCHSWWSACNGQEGSSDEKRVRRAYNKIWQQQQQHHHRRRMNQAKRQH